MAHKQIYALLLGASLFGASLAAQAIPMLQLGIGNGYYDTETETSVTNAGQFTLFAYGKATGNKTVNVNETHYISVAVSPKLGPAPEPIGTFSIGTNNFTIADMVYGNPPIEDFLEKDPHDLSSHGVFDTFFLEIAFQFSASQTTASVNVQDDPDHVPVSGSGNALYYKAFDIDVTGMLAGYNLHFDLYNVKLRNGGDIDVNNFAPFSHDAGSHYQAEVDEPGVVLLLLSGVALMGMRRRKIALPAKSIA